MDVEALVRRSGESAPQWWLRPWKTLKAMAPFDAGFPLFGQAMP